MTSSLVSNEALPESKKSSTASAAVESNKMSVLSKSAVWCKISATDRLGIDGVLVEEQKPYVTSLAEHLPSDSSRMPDEQYGNDGTVSELTARFWRAVEEKVLKARGKSVVAQLRVEFCKPMEFTVPRIPSHPFCNHASPLAERNES